MDVNPKQCKQTLEDGTQCGAWALKTGEHCYSHDMDSRDAKKTACSKGGLNKNTGIKEPLETVCLKSPEDAVTLLCKVINEVREGKIDLRSANCLGYLSGHLIKAFELSQTNQRLEAIEAVFNDLPIRRIKDGK